MIWFLLIILLCMVKSRTKFTFFSPIVVFYSFFILSLLLSIPYHHFMPEDWKFNIAQLDRINDTAFSTAIETFIKMLIYFSIGVVFYKYAFRVSKNKDFKFDLTIKLPSINVQMLELLSIVIIVIDLILLWALYGNEFFIRNSYTMEANKLGVMTLEYSLLSLMFLAGVLYKNRILSSFAISVFVTLLCIGFGSRMATIYFMVYSFVVYVLYFKPSERQIFWVFISPFIVIFMGYNIALRFSDSHGLLPYLLLPIKDPGAIVENTFFNIYYTLVFGIFATYKTLIENPVEYNYLYTSLNPSPGFMTDWYIIYEELRINPYAPFTAIGEIFTYPNIAFFFYFFVGIFFSYCEGVILRLLSNNKIISGFILFIITVAFIPYSFEYNLRSTVRFIYYSTFVIIIIKTFKIPKLKL